MYNILICDDQPDIVNALKIYLTPEGYNLFTASTGREALELARQEDLHLILLDIMMPQMDGITATAKIREFSNVPIILLTAKSETEDKVLARLAQAKEELNYLPRYDYVVYNHDGGALVCAQEILEILRAEQHSVCRHPDAIEQYFKS